MSGVTIYTSKPSPAERRAIDPITSSASKPGIISTGIFIARTISDSGSSASMMSCGVSGRLALYSGYISFLNVPPGGSKATARCVGFSRSIISSRYLVKPNNMDVSIPFELTIGRLRKA